MPTSGSLGGAYVDPEDTISSRKLRDSTSSHVPVLPAAGSMLSIVQDHWMDVCSFFGDAQCASSAEERAAVARQLPRVEHNLNLIFDALVTERRRIGVVLKAPLSSLEHRSTLAARLDSNSVAGEAPLPQAQPPASLSGDLPWLASASLHSATRGSDATGNWPPTASLLQGNLVNQLPPCYYYLFAEDQPNASGSTSELHRTSRMDSAHADAPSTPPSPSSAPPTPFRPTVKSQDVPRAAPSSSHHPVPVGTTFLFLLCQYAKLNEPAGTRQIILRFLTRLLRDADLPSRRVTTSLTDGGGDQVRSILQLFPGSSIVPLLDMIRILDRDLNPSQYAAKHKRVAAATTTTSAAPQGTQDKSRLEHAAATPPPSDDAERRELILLLCGLAEKAERIPELANYFASEKRATNGTEAAAADLAAGCPQAHTSELLKTLLPYLTHDCSAPGWEQRRDTCRYALSAALSLAKCPDPWVQDIVGAESRLASHTLSGARVTVLTLCKVPNNDDSEMQLLYLRDVLRFWSAVHLTSPVVSHRLGLPSLVRNDFVRTTVMPLFQSPDKRVYTAACLVVASVLKDQGSADSLVSEALVDALLATRVGATSGTPARRGLEPSDEGQTVSLYEYYCLCHLTSHPGLTADDRAMMQALGYKISTWTATEATLVLTKALATYCPHAFLRHALHTEPGSLASSVVSRLSQTSFSSTVAKLEAESQAAVVHSEAGATVSSSQTPMRHVSPLSAAASAPHIRLLECFAPKLRLPGDSLFGVSADLVGEEVLERMLAIESNCPAQALLSAALFMHSDEAALCKQMDSSTSSSPPFAESSATERAGAAMAAGAHNIWFDQNIHQSPLVIALCRLLQSALQLPVSVKLLLSGTIAVLCSLPDLRVVYTLLDPEYGRLDHTLQAVRALLENELEEDEEVVTALGAAAAAVAEDTMSLNVTKYKDKAAAAQESRGRSSSGGRALPAAAASSSRKESQGARVHELVSFTGALYTRHYVYSVFAANWDDFATDSVEDGPQDLDVSEALRRAIAEHHEFLNTCAWLELFRMELDAVVGYVSLSHNLLTLRP